MQGMHIKSLLFLLAAVTTLVTCKAPTRVTITDLEQLPQIEIVDVNGPLDMQASADLVDRVLGRSPDSRHMLPVLQRAQLISESPLYINNELSLLVDGPRTYEAMLEEIDQATSHIHLETYIFSSDEVGSRFRKALLDRLAHGVEVKVIYDGFGSIASNSGFFRELTEAGAEVLEWNPVNPLNGGNPIALPFRNHRKLLIVDGVTAFTGGINITEDYSSSSLPIEQQDSTEDTQTKNGWRDTHIRISGSAVQEFQKLFVESWNLKADEEARITNPDRYYRKDVRFGGAQLVRVMSSEGGDLELSEVREGYLDAIAKAQRNIWITQAYFIPDAGFLDALKSAAQRGVDVRLLLPGASDSTLAINAARAHYTGLLESGVRIWETDDIVLHAKTAVIDNVWSTVGSSNLDALSFFFNHEINAMVIGHPFGEALADRFEQDLEMSNQIRLDDWKARPLLDKSKQQLSRLLKHFL